MKRIIRAPSAWPTLGLRELWAFRELFVSLAARDIKLRYRQTMLGVVWLILQPAIGAVALSFIFGRIAKLSTDGIPHLMFAYAGFIFWNSFNGTLTKVSSSLAWNASLVRKVFFPRLVLPLTSFATMLVDMAAPTLVLIAAMLVTHHPLLPQLLLLPLIGALGLLFATGLGLLLSGAAVYYRDVQLLLPLLIQGLLFLSPVAYSMSSVPESARLLYRLNPLCGFLEVFRWSLFGIPPDWHDAGISLASCVVAFAAGLAAFARSEQQVVDVL